MMTKQYKIEIEREEGDLNAGCFMTIDGETFNWHEGSEEDKQMFREMLIGFTDLFTRC